jgi:hypothetical protein
MPDSTPIAPEPPPVVQTVVVKREESIPHTALAETPATMPNVILKALSPVKVVVIRALRVFFQTLASGIGATSAAAGASSAGVNIEALKALQNLDFKAIVILAAFAALACAIQNTAELFAKLDQTMPELRA